MKRRIACTAALGGLAVVLLTGCAPAATGGADAASITARTGSGGGAASGAAGGGTAVAVLSTLTVKGRAPMTGYDRDQFGAAWSDVDHNGCDTRNDVLTRDLTLATYKVGTHNCVVLTGTLADPYTATSIDFVRGSGTSVDIDHVVALGDAWQTGAFSWTEARRTALANDPANLLAVDYAANRQKGDADAASWLPGNKAYRCDYVARQVAVKAAYGLWVTQAEHDAMATVLDGCPSESTPSDGASTTAAGTSASGASAASVATSSAGAGTASSTAAAKSSAVASSRSQATARSKAEAATSKAARAKAAAASAAAASSEASSDSGSDVGYANCAAVRAAGAAPLHRGDPGYSTTLDRDQDGVACE